jgi:hypothetical protein
MNPNPITRRDFLKLSAVSFCGACLAACGQTPDAAPDQTYLRKNSQKLIRDFDAILNPVRNLMVELCGESETAAILQESHTAYEALLLQVPYIGGDDNALTETLYMSAGAMAFYQVMLAHGQPVEETGRILYRAMEALYNINDPLSWAMTRNPTGKGAQDEFRRIAKWSAQNPYPGDWQLTFVEGNAEFDFGVDYTECGLVKLYQAHDAAPLAPYLCLGDFAMSKAVNSGLVRTTTLARGGPRCDFRFKAGRPIQMEWTPEFLQEDTHEQ